MHSSYSWFKTMTGMLQIDSLYNYRKMKIAFCERMRVKPVSIKICFSENAIVSLQCFFSRKSFFEFKTFYFLYVFLSDRLMHC